MEQGKPEKAIKTYIEALRLYRQAYPQSVRYVQHRVLHDKESSLEAFKSLDGILGDVKESVIELKRQGEAYKFQGA